MQSDVRSVRARMTLEEKAALCTGATAWTTVPVARLGIPSIRVADGPHGVRRVADADGLMSESLPATCYPTASALASTWDADLVRTLGKALGEECIALGVDIVLGPGNNMKRTPLCGRNFEYYAEDPFLGGEMAAAFIEGVQSVGVGTSLKHYAANNQEHKRFVIDAQVGERTLREIYLAGFERAVRKAQPWTVMCAYNRLNGTFCSHHRWLLEDVLRDEWGYAGFVVSDWGAVHDRVEALAAGLELEMPGPRPDRVKAVIDAVRGGSLDEGVLDRAVERLLEVILKASETPKGGGEIDVDGHHALARRVAGEAIVLLKNEGDLLPLRSVRRIAVIGAAAQTPYFQGGGSSHVNPTRVDIPLEKLRALAGDAEIRYAAGYTMEQGETDQALIDEAVAIARDADVALLYVALPAFKESEGYDRPDLSLTEQQVALIQTIAAAQPHSVVILNNGSAVTMDPWIDDVPAVLEAWMMGQAGGGAIADVLFGVVNPSGKLAETFPRRMEDTPAYLNYPGENGSVHYGEGMFIGYRYYDAKGLDVLYPFGYGLSYTTFDYSDLRVSARSITDTEGLTVSVEVTNTGGVAGKEIVQVYVRDVDARLTRPDKELKGFAKVALEPGATKTVTIELDAHAFTYYDPAYQQWVTESGRFEILVGRSAADLCLSASVQMTSTQVLPSILDLDSTVGEWTADPVGVQVLGPVLQKVVQQMRRETGGDSEWMGMDLSGFVADLPLTSVLGFFGGQLPAPPEEIARDLLAQVHERGR